MQLEKHAIKVNMCLHISQNPTDHYELPSTMDKAVENLSVKPDKISADTIINKNPHYNTGKRRI